MDVMTSLTLRHAFKIPTTDAQSAPATAAPISATICQEKAKCSALSTKPSKVFEDMIKNGRNGFLSISNFVGLLEGGLPIVYEGQVVGAVGVSGVQSHQDADIAQHAIDKFLAQAG